MIPQIGDVEIVNLLKELVDLYENPPKGKYHLNLSAFRKYLEGHPDGEIEILYIEQGYPLFLDDRTPEKT